MKFINPLGRDLDNGITPRACICNSSYFFAGARGVGENCSHCGCHCDPSVNNSGTYGTAANSNRV